MRPFTWFTRVKRVDLKVLRLVDGRIFRYVFLAILLAGYATSYDY